MKCSKLDMPDDTMVIFGELAGFQEDDKQLFSNKESSGLVF